MTSVTPQSPVLLPAWSVPGTRLAALQFHSFTLHYSLLLADHLLFILSIIQMEKQAQRNKLTSFYQIYVAGGLIWFPPKPFPAGGLFGRDEDMSW